MGEVFVMVRYPVSMGAFREANLDQVFGYILGNQPMNDRKCTFGASMTEYDGHSCPMVPLQASTVPQSLVSSLVSKYESLEDAVQPSGSPRHPSIASASSASSGGSSTITTGFYLKSVTEECRELKPTILVEIYTNSDSDINNIDGFVNPARACIEAAIKCNLLKETTMDTNIHFLFSTVKKML